MKWEISFRDTNDQSSLKKKIDNPENTIGKLKLETLDKEN